MPKVIYASAKDSDMLYAVKANILDPFFYIEISRKKYIFLDYREFGVFKKENKIRNLEPILLNPLQESAHKQRGKGSRTEKLAYYLFKRYKLLGKEVQVPTSFPLDLADYLRARGVKLRPIAPLFPEREIKTSRETAGIKSCLNRTKKAYEFVERVLQNSIIRKKKIYYRGKVLTSEYLKREIDLIFLKDGLINSEGMIISSGRQAAIPHHTGSGPIRPHQPIICDIFPRDRENGYFADMTRTYFKGEPDGKLIKLYQTVLRVQTAAINAIRPGVSAGKIFQLCVDSFRENGYHSGDRGFIHGAGHGVGLDIHEAPSLSSDNPNLLKPGNIVTVEPGLYYPSLGGVRIEDMILVAKTGQRNLTDYPKKLKIF